MFLRRLRGLFAVTAGGALVGGIVGILLGSIGLLIPGPTKITPQFPGAIIIVPAVLGAGLGAMSGAAFGVLLMLAERGRPIAELRASRVALWASLASVVVVRLTGTSWILAALGGCIGGGVGLAASFLAKRAPEPSVSDGTVSTPPA